MFDIFDKLPICHDVNTGNRTKDVCLDDGIRFSTLLMETKIQQGLSKCGYLWLSPIQKATLPLTLTGSSIIAHAKSGTGKTLIYILTALNMYLKSELKNNLFCVIITPTREISKQVYDVCKRVSCFIPDLKVEYFIGGTPLDIDVVKCNQCNIAVGAPGRILHLVSLGELEPKDVRLVVLDEVDALLTNPEYGIEKLISFLPIRRQTIVCSATFNNDIEALLKPIDTNIKYIAVSKDDLNNEKIFASNVLLGVKQLVAPVKTSTSSLNAIHKRDKLVQILENWNYQQCIVFVNYITMVKSIYNFLTRKGLSACWMSSDQNQSDRINTLNKMKLNEFRILVTTDLASRGIDIHNMDLVINIGIPNPPDVYIHRMGRAGRYGSEGSVITIVNEGSELQLFQRVVKSVISDPIDLYILPSIVSKISHNMNDCSIVNCVPTPDPELIQQLSFNGKNKTICNDKRKKKIKKEDKALISTAVITANDDHSMLYPEKVDNSSLENAKSALNTFCSMLLTECSEIKGIDGEELEDFLVPMKRKKTRFQFTDYKDTSMYKYEDVNYNEIEISKSSQSFESLVNFISQKNQKLDSQKFPMCLEDFFKIYKHNESNVLKFISCELHDFVRDLLNKAQSLVQLPNKYEFTTIAATTTDSRTTNKSLHSLEQAKECENSLFANKMRASLKPVCGYTKHSSETIKYPQNYIDVPIIKYTLQNDNSRENPDKRPNTFDQHLQSLSLSAFVNNDRERLIWKHHLNYIKNSVTSSNI